MVTLKKFSSLQFLKKTKSAYYPFNSNIHMAKTDVISSCLVPMATNTSISRMELTPWDLELILLDPIQKGIFFHKPKSQNFQKNIINHLKNSLSRTLDSFPPLAGRLGTIKCKKNNTCYFIDCNNVGAEFTHVIVRAVSVSDILNSTYIPEIVSSLFPLNGIRNFEGVSKPLLGVQVNELIDGYFIACTANHMVVDGTSFWHFFNSWSEISRGVDKISKKPTFDRWFPSNIPNHNIPLPPILPQNLSHDFVSPRLLERVFHFSKESVAKLKSKANSEAGSTKISSLQALSAHLWKSVVRARHLQSVGNLITSKEIYYFLMVGARQRIPLPEGYFGNAAYVARTSISEDEVLRNGLGFAALKINELVSKQTKEVMIEFVEDWVKNPTIWTKNSVNFIISSSPRFDVYGNDFGWGKPVAVRSGKGQKVDGKMTAFPAATPGGIDVEVCLTPETLHALEDDAEFMEATSDEIFYCE